LIYPIGGGAFLVCGLRHNRKRSHPINLKEPLQLEGGVTAVVLGGWDLSNDKRRSDAAHGEDFYLTLKGQFLCQMN
jgi:hypothetical protein